MNHDTHPSRTALLAGASGLIGRALLTRLQANPAYTHTHVLVRRPVPGLTGDTRTTFHTVDFARLLASMPPGLPGLTDAYIALGTTIAVAGSVAAFRAVDFDVVVNTARAARAAGATRLAVVSSLGADANSRVFYNRVKGEMQATVATLGYRSVVIAQPSLLLGDRAALGQPVRTAERWATRLFTPVAGLVPRSVRPIEAGAVADALLAAMLEAAPGVRVLASKDMQP